jgi:hypothetical protein
MGAGRRAGCLVNGAVGGSGFHDMGGCVPLYVMSLIKVTGLLENPCIFILIGCVYCKNGSLDPLYWIRPQQFDDSYFQMCAFGTNRNLLYPGWIVARRKVECWLWNKRINRVWFFVSCRMKTP